MPLGKRPLDLVLVVCFLSFAFTSLVMEPYVVFHVDFLHRAGDPFAWAWRTYAGTWDPIFLDAPPWLRLLSGADAFLYGPFYLVLAYAFIRGRDFIRMPAIVWAAVISFGTTFYFAMEFWQEHERANLPMVVAVNLPYLIVPIVTAVRLRKPRPFES